MKYIKLTILILALFISLALANKAHAATEFVSTIRAAGGNYSLLSTWEAAVQSNLTASTTVVYSGTGAGGISAGATLELFRGGEYQNITALKIATTSSQLLVQTFTGSYKVLQNNDQWRVASSTNNMWTVSSAGLGDSAIAVAQIDGAWASADTTAVTINGWTTSATNYIKVYTTASARHNGKWDTGKYRLVPSSSGSSITAGQATLHIRFEGLQVGVNGSTSVATGFNFDGWYAGSGDVRISYCIIKDTIPRTRWYWHRGISISNTANYYIWNNILYDFLKNSLDSTSCVGIYTQTVWSNYYIYNNTVVNCDYGFSTTAPTIIIKNNIAQNCTDGFSGTFNAASNYNLSDLAGDAPGANSKNSTNVAFVDEANDDFHLSSSDSGAKNQGTDLSGDGNYPITDDIDYQTRPYGGIWDIGADETPFSAFKFNGGTFKIRGTIKFE